MKLLRYSSILLLGCAVLGAAAQGEDPVLKARAERARAQGVPEGDLPPVPRAIVEPPPLPPPETHLKDLPRAKVAKVRKGSGTKGVKAPATRTAKVTKTPAKGGRKTSKKGKG
ncbi:MAG TPA: hypothetical protein VK188_13570 [Holophaga sp.]|nr:hypothetical protein [Holophaga sp.]